MKKIVATLLLTMGLMAIVNAAYLKNVPQTLIQPNGDTLHCFASGDEYFHYLHDAEGFTIVQNPATGYFVYAAKQDGKVVCTDFVAGKVNPEEVGLKRHVCISSAEYQQKRGLLSANLRPTARTNRDANVNHGTLNNLVIFIHLADDEPSDISYAEVDEMFNDSTVTQYSTANSMYNYFKYCSYNSMFVKSLLIPQTTDNTIVSFEDIHPRGYYMPWSETNPIGYLSDEESPEDNRTTREHALLVRALEYINDNQMVPADLNIDYNEDGLVDNICFVVSGDVAGWSDLLWPHKWCLYTQEVYINDKLVWDFNFELIDNAWYFSNSCMSHEMSHTLGAPDLYHYDDDFDFTPVGPWDLMAANGQIPQHWGAYMKYMYGNWVSEEDIPWLTESGQYTLYPVSSPSPHHIAYRIQSEDPDEYFVIEFRTPRGKFENSLPSGGAVIYRINRNFEGWGNASWNGDDVLDEIYIYRPGGTTTQDGNINDAGFAPSLHRTEFNMNTDPQPFLSSGYITSLNICAIRNWMQDSLTFWYLLPGDTIPSEIQDRVSDVSVYPVPAVTQFTVANSVLPLEVVQVFDLSGKCVHSVQPSSNQCVINVDGWTAGTYIVRFQTSAGVSQKKIVVGK